MVIQVFMISGEGFMFCQRQKIKNIILFLFVTCLFGILFFGFSAFSNDASAESTGTTIEDFYDFKNAVKNLTEADSQQLSLSSLSTNESSLEDSVYKLRRLIVIGDIKEDYGAVYSIDYDNIHILCYDSESSTAKAYQSFCKDNANVIIDQEIKVNSYADNTYNYSSDLNWGGEAIEVKGIRDYLQTNGSDEEIVVAVLDSGINPTHRLIQGRILTDQDGNLVGSSYVDSTVAGREYDFEDDNNHGSNVSGIITMLTPSNVKILPIKTMGADGSGYFSYITAALKEIEDVYSNQYNICAVNLSLGGVYSQSTANAMDELFDSLREKNILTVVAAGNDQMDTAEFMPASSDSAITVSALEEASDGIYQFDKDYSNYGASVDISAPGSNIRSASARDEYDTIMDGTSQATPHVSAAIALLCLDGRYWSGSNPTYTADTIEARLYDNTVDLGKPGRDKYYGEGMLNLKYFDVENSQDFLTFQNGNGETIEIEPYIEFSGSYTLNVIAPDSSYEIYYTTDSTVPNRNTANRYISTLRVTDSTIYYFMGYKIENNSITASTDIYVVDLFDSSDDISKFFVNNNGTLTNYTGHFTEITLPSTIDGQTFTALGDYLFDESELVSITLPDTCITFGVHCFANCSDLTYVDADKVVNIGAYAFENCTSLASIDLYSAQVLGQKIEDEAINGHIFVNCTSLTAVNLPDVTYMGEDLFEGSSVTRVGIGRSFVIYTETGETTIRNYYGRPIASGITIYGYSGSDAQTLASNYRNTFIPIDSFSITNNLSSQATTSRNSNFTLSIEVSGYDPKYQWYQTENNTSNGTPLAGQTSNTLNVDTSQTGEYKYYVVVTDWEGNTHTSNICTVTVEGSVAQIYRYGAWEYYGSIEDALLQSQAGDIVVLTDDCIVNSYLTIPHDITLVSTNNAKLIISSLLQTLSLTDSRPIITLQGSLTLGYNQPTYQGLTLTDITIEGQISNGLYVLFSSSQSLNLTINARAQISNLTVNTLLDGNLSLALQGGKITNVQANNILINANEIYLTDGEISNNSAQVILSATASLQIDNAIVSQNTATDLIQSNGCDITINDGTFSNNTLSRAFIYFSVIDDGTLSQLNLVSGTLSENQTVYELYITDENFTGTQKNLNCVSLGDFNISNVYINNSKSNPAINVTSQIDHTINIDGYNLSAFEVGGSPIITYDSQLNLDLTYLRNEKYNFVDIDQSGQVYLQEKTSHILTYIVYDNYTITDNYYVDQEIKLIPDPEREGYNFQGWFTDETYQTPFALTYMPDEDVTVYAKWEIITFIITIDNSENGSISQSGNVQVDYGSSLTLTFSPDLGYEVSRIVVDNVELSADELELHKEGYTFENITSAHSIYVEFGLKDFKITYMLDHLGLENMSQTYKMGNTITLPRAPFISNYQYFEGWYDSFDGESYQDKHQFSTMPAQDITVYGRFLDRHYIINVSANAHGQINTTSFDITYPNSAIVTMIADTGYYIGNITVDSNDISQEDLTGAVETNSFEFLIDKYGSANTDNSPSETHEIYIEFLPYLNKITFHLNYEDGGSIEETFYTDETITLPNTPTRIGHTFMGWFYDEACTNTFDLEYMPYQNIDLYAKWEISSYRITASARGNGSISPAGENFVTYQDQLLFTFTPNTGYHVGSIIVDGNPLTGSALTNAIASGYTFEGVETDHTILVEFEINTYIVNLTVSGNGQVQTQSNLNMVRYGDDVILTLVSNFNKYGADIYINGSKVKSEREITLENVDRNMSVIISFYEKPFIETTAGIISITAIIVALFIIIILCVIGSLKRKKMYEDMENY